MCILGFGESELRLEVQGMISCEEGQTTMSKQSNLNY